MKEHHAGIGCMEENKVKLVVTIMGQDCKDFLEICLKSVEGADAIVFCDGGSKEEFLWWLIQQGFRSSADTDLGFGAMQYGQSNKRIIQQEFKQDDPQMNGKQRQFYLNFLKEHYKGWYCLALDADEFVHDIEPFKKFINNPSVNKPSYATEVNQETLEEKQVPIRRLYNPRMRHLVYSFIQEDATQALHWAPHRLFEITDDLYYPPGEHNVILRTDLDAQTCQVKNLVVWHLAYAPMFHIKRRYFRNLQMSEVHDKLYLQQWNEGHLFGQYPTKVLQPIELPKFFLSMFGINYDEIYFRGRQEIETKHWLDACHWKEYFGLTQGNEVIEIGAGLGPRVAALRLIGVEAVGIDNSQWAVDHAIVKNTIMLKDITEAYTPGLIPIKYKLVVAYDLLEHIPYELLDKALDNIIGHVQKYLLVSVPTIGDPNLEADPTHIIKESKEWWRETLLEKGLEELPVPSHFLYAQQLFIFKVNS